MARRIIVQFIGDASSLKGATAQAEAGLGGLSTKLRKIGAVAGVALAAGGIAVVKFGSDSVRAASDMNETLSKSQVIFGRNASAMEKWAGSAARSAGLSKQAALESAASFGDMFSQLGFAGKQAAGMSKDVVQLSADLGSFNNLPTAEVTDMMSAAFRGEYDSLQRVIPNINAARVEHEALAATGKATAKELTAQEKAAATLAIVQRDGARAAGDFARTSSGAANQQKIFAAQLENVKIKVGKYLLPAVTKLITWVNDRGLPAFDRLISKLASLGPAVDRVRGVISRLMSGLQGDVGGGMSTIGSIVRDQVQFWTYVWDKWGKDIMAIVRSLMNVVGKIISGALLIIRGLFRVISGLIRGDWGKAWAGVKDIVRGALRIVIALVKNSATLLKAALKVAWDVLRNLTASAWNGIKNAVSAGIDKVIAGVKSLGQRFTDALKQIPAKSVLIGRDIIGGLLNGIRARAGEVIAMMRGLAGDALRAVKEKLGIASPSKRFHEIGGNVGEGFARGAESKKGRIKGALKQISADLLQQTAAAGESGQAQIHALAGGSSSEVSQFNSIDGQISRLLGQAGSSAAGAIAREQVIKVEVKLDGQKLAEATHKVLLQRKHRVGTLGLA